MITFDALLEAMNKVEASGRKTKVPPGDGGTRIGPLQISQVYFDEAIEWLNKNGIGLTVREFTYQWEGCHTWTFSKMIVWAYMNRWARKALMEGDWERIARVHNGGPNGWKKKATLAYWEKVKDALKKVE